MDIQKITHDSIAHIDEKLKTWREELQQEVNDAIKRKEIELERLKKEFIELNAACEDIQLPWHLMDHCKYLFTNEHQTSEDSYHCQGNIEIRFNGYSIFNATPYAKLNKNTKYRFTLLITEEKHETT